MSTMRYVGARYVPKWYVNSVDQSSNWEVNVEYEPLTWVTTLNNHLYLSKKTVPDNIGTPAQNTAYWLDMGQMTGDLQNIQDEIDAITANMGDLSDLSTTDKTSLVNAINEIAGGVSPTPSATSRKYVFYGDSYGTTYTIDGTTITGWCEKLPLIMNLDAAQYTTQATSGYGFCGTGSNLQWKDWITGDPDTTVTDVAFIGGDNDIVFALTTLTDEITATLNKAKIKYPNARIWVGFCAVDLSDDATRDVSSAYEIYSKAAAANGALFMKNIAYSIQDVGLLRMPSHPNNTGTTRLAAAIATTLLYGQYHAGIHNKQATEDNADAVVQSSQTCNFYYSLHDNVITLTTRGLSPNFERCIIKFGSGISVTCDTNTTLNITKLTDVPIGHAGLIVLGNIAAYAEIGGTANWIPVSCEVTYYRGYIQLKPFAIDSNGYKSGTLTQIMFPSTTFTIPCDKYSSYL